MRISSNLQRFSQQTLRETVKPAPGHNNLPIESHPSPAMEPLDPANPSGQMIRIYTYSMPPASRPGDGKAVLLL
jgi:hypothetical protein